LTLTALMHCPRQEWPIFEQAAVGGLRKRGALYLDPRLRRESLGPYPGISLTNGIKDHVCTGRGESVGEDYT